MSVSAERQAVHTLSFEVQRSPSGIPGLATMRSLECSLEDGVKVYPVGFSYHGSGVKVLGLSYEAPRWTSPVCLTEVWRCEFAVLNRDMTEEEHFLHHDLAPGFRMVELLELVRSGCPTVFRRTGQAEIYLPQSA